MSARVQKMRQLRGLRPPTELDIALVSVPSNSCEAARSFLQRLLDVVCRLRLRRLWSKRKCCGFPIVCRVELDRASSVPDERQSKLRRDCEAFSDKMAQFLLFVCAGRPLWLGGTATAVASRTPEHSNSGALRNKVRRAGQRIVVRLPKARHERVRRLERQRVGAGRGAILCRTCNW
jgi:hypothetical protein